MEEAHRETSNPCEPVHRACVQRRSGLSLLRILQRTGDQSAKSAPRSGEFPCLYFILHQREIHPFSGGEIQNTATALPVLGDAGRKFFRGEIPLRQVHRQPGLRRRLAALLHEERRRVSRFLQRRHAGDRLQQIRFTVQFPPVNRFFPGEGGENPHRFDEHLLPPSVEDDEQRFRRPAGQLPEQQRRRIFQKGGLLPDRRNAALCLRIQPLLLEPVRI